MLDAVQRLMGQVEVKWEARQGHEQDHRSVAARQPVVLVWLVALQLQVVKDKAATSSSRWLVPLASSAILPL